MNVYITNKVLVKVRDPKTEVCLSGKLAILSYINKRFLCNAYGDRLAFLAYFNFRV